MIEYSKINCGSQPEYAICTKSPLATQNEAIAANSKTTTWRIAVCRSAAMIGAIEK